MLRIHSRMSAATRYVVTYRAGAIECDAPDEQWMMLRKEDGPWTCLLANDMSLIYANVGAPGCSYSIVERESERVRLETRPHQIRVTGNVTAHIHWEHAGEIQLIVETGARAYFYSRNTRTQLVVAARDRAQVALGGVFWSIAPSVDTYSRLVSRARCVKQMHVNFRGAITAPLEFPHAETDCCRVEDDTPDDQQCGICCERTNNAVFSPCKHSYMCLVCADRYQRSAVLDFTCPLCRMRIAKVTPR